VIDYLQDPDSDKYRLAIMVPTVRSLGFRFTFLRNEKADNETQGIGYGVRVSSIENDYLSKVLPLNATLDRIVQVDAKTGQVLQYSPLLRDVPFQDAADILKRWDPPLQLHFGLNKFLGVEVEFEDTPKGDVDPVHYCGQIQGIDRPTEDLNTLIGNLKMDGKETDQVAWLHFDFNDMTWRDEVKGTIFGKFTVKNDFFKPVRIPVLREMEISDSRPKSYVTTIQFNHTCKSRRENYERLGFEIKPIFDDEGEAQDIEAMISAFHNPELEEMLGKGAQLKSLGDLDLRNMHFNDIEYKLKHVTLPCQIEFVSQSLAPLSSEYFKFNQSTLETWSSETTEMEVETRREQTPEQPAVEQNQEVQKVEEEEAEKEELFEEEELDEVRVAWTVGSKVEVKSQTLGMWLKGTINVIEHDEEGEWLIVKYDTPDGRNWKKETARGNVDIRPCVEEAPEKEESDSSPDQTEDALPSNFEELNRLMTENATTGLDDLSEEMALLDELRGELKVL